MDNVNKNPDNRLENEALEELLKDSVLLNLDFSEEEAEQSPQTEAAPPEPDPSEMDMPMDMPMDISGGEETLDPIAGRDNKGFETAAKRRPKPSKRQTFDAAARQISDAAVEKTEESWIIEQKTVKVPDPVQINPFEPEIPKPVPPNFGKSNGVKQKSPDFGNIKGAKPEPLGYGKEKAAKPEPPDFGKDRGAKTESAGSGEERGVRPNFPYFGNNRGTKSKFPYFGDNGDTKPKSPDFGLVKSDKTKPPDFGKVKPGKLEFPSLANQKLGDIAFPHIDYPKPRKPKPINTAGPYKPKPKSKPAQEKSGNLRFNEKQKKPLPALSTDIIPKRQTTARPQQQEHQTPPKEAKPERFDMSKDWRKSIDHTFMDKRPAEKEESKRGTSARNDRGMIKSIWTRQSLKKSPLK